MKFIEKIEGADTIAIGGHVRPDGDRIRTFYLFYEFHFDSL